MYQMLSIARGHITTRNLIYKVINKPKNTRRFNFQEFYKSLNVCGRIKRMNETDASTINKKKWSLTFFYSILGLKFYSTMLQFRDA